MFSGKYNLKSNFRFSIDKPMFSYQQLIVDYRCVDCKQSLIKNYDLFYILSPLARYSGPSGKQNQGAPKICLLVFPGAYKDERPASMCHAGPIFTLVPELLTKTSSMMIHNSMIRISDFFRIWIQSYFVYE